MVPTPIVYARFGTLSGSPSEHLGILLARKGHEGLSECETSRRQGFVETYGRLRRFPELNVNPCSAHEHQALSTFFAMRPPSLMSNARPRGE